MKRLRIGIGHRTAIGLLGALVLCVAMAPARADAVSSERVLGYMFDELIASMNECTWYMNEAAELKPPVLGTVELRVCNSMAQQSKAFLVAARKHAARYPSADATTILRHAVRMEADLGSKKF